ncbi:VOC family protein [Runella sp.]|jgi:PhnB protein|uniref:VOC family protein n=2 Tax=Runella sp. TaxID=1960881 RepID=UPI00301B6632
MVQINPYLNFNGNCKEAMTFYQSCLGGELTLQPLAESPMAAQMPSEAGAQILHGALNKNGTTLLLGSDMIGSNRVSGNSVTLCIHCHSKKEIVNCFDQLASGGQVIEPLHQTFWGATFGMLTDKFGNTWAFNYAKS